MADSSPAAHWVAGVTLKESTTLNWRYSMSNVIIISFAIVFAAFFSVYVGGMFMFSKCKEVDRDRHSQCMS
jgi:hypothetical protein